MTAASPAAELAIVFVGMSGSGSDAVLDTGMVSGPRGAIVRTLGIRLDSGTRTTGTAVVRVWLESHDERTAIRIDGMSIGTLPRILDAHAPLGRVIAHRLEIDVPPDVPEGAVASSIRWEATTDGQ